MLTAFRWLFRIAVALVVLAVGGAAVVYYFAARSLPDYDAAHRLEGLSGPVEIVRDNANVPHIFAPTDADVFFALGFAHAQDRLWQMTLLRRTVQGRLSEVFGARTARTDELMRRLDLYGLARQSVAAQDDDTAGALAAYARGVNAWIGVVNDRALGRGAPEFFLFPAEIAVWTPADSIALMKLMALQVTGQIATEVQRARLSLLLRPERVADLMPETPGPPVMALPDFAALLPGAPRTAAAPPPPPALSPVAARGLAGASNAFAAAPGRTAGHGALLANDPHLGFTAPALWYLARLELASGGVIGGTIPGIPAVLVGRGENLGWGLTTAYLDDLDLFVERLNPDNPAEYLTPEGWKPFVTRRAIVEIRDAPPLTLTLRWSENGPVLPGAHFDLAAITPPGHVMALSWTALSAEDTTMSAALRLMRSASVGEAIAAGRLTVAPAQMVTLADRGGVAIQLAGAMPRRDPRHQTEGRMPAPGWLAANRWQGVLPYEDNPRIANPPTGIVGNTNNRITDGPFPRHVSHDWGDTQRVLRWLRLMRARDVHTRESFIEAQLDTVSFAARALVALVGADLFFTGEAAAEGSRERLRARALALLADWTGEMNEHLPEPLIYSAWMRALQERLIRDDLGPYAAAFTHVEPLFIERVFRDVDGAAAWCDIIQSAAVESCTDIARLALDDALLALTERYGLAVESWRWGDAHQATHDHTVLGEVAVLRHFVNIRQSTSGDDHTLNRGLSAGSGNEPFRNVHGPGYRGVYDFGDPDSSVFVIATGQSGHFLSRHYDDLGERWRRGEYIPMSLDPDLARAAAVGITRLEPR
ncbi:MAG: penicillin acylase family protein [Rhodobacteraceae bacterium]|jgi:penicillin amidase|nr:penicillin acylase family protein [Paracoccaceae bacterium]